MIDLDAVGYGNGLIYIGIPRERISINNFIDNRDSILSHLAKAGRSCGYWQAEGHRVDRNRDQICEAFKNHEKKPEWLMMLDTDMEHPVEAPLRLTAFKKPITGALYFHRGESHDPFVFDYIGSRKDKYGRDTHTWAPRRDQVYEWLNANSVPMRDGSFVIDHPLSNPLVECDAVATGCIVIHRSVIESMPAPWFEYRQGGNSEDLMFCKEAKEQGIPVHADLSTVCGHYNWVAMGQAQFRMNYINRGINLTAYSIGVAARWWSTFFKCSIDEAGKAIDQGNAAVVGQLWVRRFGKRTPSAEEVAEFYLDPEVGKTYILELLHWNFTPTFNMVRRTLTSIRDKTVLEIGSGIGSVALQLWIQGCNVLAAEVNPLLRDFIDLRYAELHEEIVGSIGQLSIVDDSWIEKTEDESLDYVVSFDTFEHMPIPVLKKTLEATWNKLKLDGRLVYTANFKQQETYPMHYDHSKRFDDLLIGFERLSNMELKKVKK